MSEQRVVLVTGVGGYWGRAWLKDCSPNPVCT